MCDFSGRLVAWMDGELAENETTEVERHVAGCAQCRQRVSSYEEVSRAFAAYYTAMTRASEEITSHRKSPRWVPVAAGAAAALLIAVVLLPRSAKQVPPAPQVAAQTPPAGPETATALLKPAVKRHVAAHKKTQTANWAMAGPAIQIAIPAESMFPPGAVPEGIAYIANLSFAADGSVQGLRLQP